MRPKISDRVQLFCIAASVLAVVLLLVWIRVHNKPKTATKQEIDAELALMMVEVRGKEIEHIPLEDVRKVGTDGYVAEHPRRPALDT
jgi:hypothetical protein